MIELKNTTENGSQTWLIRHTDDEGADLHKPQPYAVARGVPGAAVEAFAAQVLANHQAVRPLTWREETEADRKAERRAKEQVEAARQRRKAIKEWKPEKGQIQKRIEALEALVTMMIEERR